MAVCEAEIRGWGEEGDESKERRGRLHSWPQEGLARPRLSWTWCLAGCLQLHGKEGHRAPLPPSTTSTLAPFLFCPRNSKNLQHFSAGQMICTSGGRLLEWLQQRIIRAEINGMQAVWNNRQAHIFNTRLSLLNDSHPLSDHLYFTTPHWSHLINSTTAPSVFPKC